MLYMYDVYTHESKDFHREMFHLISEMKHDNLLMGGFDKHDLLGGTIDTLTVYKKSNRSNFFKSVTQASVVFIFIVYILSLLRHARIEQLLTNDLCVLAADDAGIKRYAIKTAMSTFENQVARDLKVSAKVAEFMFRCHGASYKTVNNFAFYLGILIGWDPFKAAIAAYSVFKGLPALYDKLKKVYFAKSKAKSHSKKTSAKRLEGGLELEGGFYDYVKLEGGSKRHFIRFMLSISTLLGIAAVYYKYNSKAINRTLTDISESSLYKFIGDTVSQHGLTSESFSKIYNEAYAEINSLITTQYVNAKGYLETFGPTYKIVDSTYRQENSVLTKLWNGIRVGLGARAAVVTEKALQDLQRNQYIAIIIQFLLIIFSSLLKKLGSGLIKVLKFFMITFPFFLFRKTIDIEEGLVNLLANVAHASMQYSLALADVKSVETIGTIGDYIPKSPRSRSPSPRSPRSPKRISPLKSSPLKTLMGRDLSMGESDPSKILLYYLVDKGITFHGPLTDYQASRSASMLKENSQFKNISNEELAKLLKDVSKISAYQS